MLHACFLLLCVRFLGVVFREEYPAIWPTLVMTVGSIGLGAWRPIAALSAFTVFVPLLNGLGATALIDCASPPSLIFSAIWIGVIAEQFFRQSQERIAQGQRTEGSERFDGRTREPAAALSPSSGPWRGKLSDRITIIFITDILISAVLLSLAIQIWRHHHSTEIGSIFQNRAILGYGDPYYFLTSAFLWLQGLFYFRVLITHRTAAIITWTNPVFAALAACMAAFFLIEFFFHVPEGWLGVGFQSPYEDISSFGSIAVAGFVFFAASQHKNPRHAMILRGIAIVGLLVMVIVSWSRATWLAASLFLLVIIWLRLPRWFGGVITFVMVAAVVIINLNTERPIWVSQIYGSRLISLVRFEQLSNKDSGRLYIYAKAVGMIQKHPLIGHGIGSFYRNSVRYARPDDPGAAKPDFAHNVFLQIASEQGVPTAALFAAVMGWTLWRGIRCWFQRTSKNQEIALLTLGVVLALGAYLQTGMTGNSLNVYVSNQFFFWFLVADVFACSAAAEVCRQGSRNSKSQVFPENRHSNSLD